MLDGKHNASYQECRGKPEYEKDDELKAPVVSVEVAAWRARQKGLCPEVEPGAGNSDRKRKLCQREYPKLWEPQLYAHAP